LLTNTVEFLRKNDISKEKGWWVMAFLDFIKNRGEQRPVAEQQSQQQKPELPNQQTLRENAPAKTVAAMPEAAKARAREIGSQVNHERNDVAQNSVAQTPAPADSASSPKVMRQDMTGRDKSQPALSPTDGQVANTALEKTEQMQSQEQRPSPAHTPHPHTRDRGGWER